MEKIYFEEVVMKEWMKLTEEEMDYFINNVCQKLHVTTWNGCDMADIYEKALSIASQNIINNSDYAKSCNTCIYGVGRRRFL